MTQPNYYNINQITVSQYTSGHELALDGNINYTGMYHILPDSTIWTGEIPTPESRQLFKYVYNEDPHVTKFKSRSNLQVTNHHLPIPYTLSRSQIDYEYPSVERYFVQNINQPTIIIEIDIDQYRSINTRNQIGIDGMLYKGTFINWYLQKEIAIYKNPEEIRKGMKIITYLDKYLVNYLEFTI